jgi:hypothetical protein
MSGALHAIFDEQSKRSSRSCSARLAGCLHALRSASLARATAAGFKSSGLPMIRWQMRLTSSMSSRLTDGMAESRPHFLRTSVSATREICSQDGLLLVQCLQGSFQVFCRAAWTLNLFLHLY